MSWREIIQQNNLVLFISRFRSILIIPSSNLGGTERVAIELERRFFQLIWETIVSDAGNKKGVL